MGYVLPSLAWYLVFLPIGIPIGCVVGTIVGGHLMEVLAPYLKEKRGWKRPSLRGDLIKAGILLCQIAALSLYVWIFVPKAIVGYEIGLWIASARMVRYVATKEYPEYSAPAALHAQRDR